MEKHELIWLKMGSSVATMDTAMYFQGFSTYLSDKLSKYQILDEDCSTYLLPKGMAMLQILLKSDLIKFALMQFLNLWIFRNYHCCSGGS